MLRSIDMQQILLQTTVVEKVQQVQQQHADVEKKLFAMHLQDDLDQRKKVVQDAKECEKAVIREEDKGKKQKGGKRLAPPTHAEQEKQPLQEPLGEREQGRIVDLIV